MQRFSPLLLLLVSATASAGTPAETYQHFVGNAASKNVKVQGYTLPAGMYYTHVIVGQSADATARVVMLHCDANECQGTTQYVGDRGATIESIALFDLAGDATATLEGVRPMLRSNFEDLPWSNPRTTSNPAPVGALVIKTMHTEKATDTYRHGGNVQGTSYEGKLAIINVQNQPMQPLLQGETLRRGASGAGVATTYTFERTAKHALLDVRVSEQKLLDDRSRCLAPDPITYLLSINKGRYTIAGERPLVGGC